jgi:hypothetical protein
MGDFDHRHKIGVLQLLLILVRGLYLEKILDNNTTSVRV